MRSPSKQVLPYRFWNIKSKKSYNIYNPKIVIWLSLACFSWTWKNTTWCKQNRARASPASIIHQWYGHCTERTVYSVQCTVYSAQCTVYTVHCTAVVQTLSPPLTPLQAATHSQWSCVVTSATLHYGVRCSAVQHCTGALYGPFAAVPSAGQVPRCSAPSARPGAKCYVSAALRWRVLR